MNIVLIGMRGSGKTDIGQKIAEILSYNFFDLDGVITTALNKNITQIVKEEGWPHFREQEAKICKSISQENNAIISTGGGIILNEKNIENLKKNGLIILLNCDVDVLKNRLKKDKKNNQDRPTLIDKNPEDEINKIWLERKEKYFNSADIVFDVSGESLDRHADIQAKAERIIALVKEKIAI
ncbi:MAG: shikimate kinase [Candidatus Peregrinibacteria bacterium]|nr:shikimate kinase [Candidatus Peregrinibacteria bacterium]